MIIPLERQAGTEHGVQVLVDIPGAEGILIVAGAVFRDPDGALEQLFQLGCDLRQTVGINLPAEVVARAVFPDAVGKARDGRARVIVDAMEIAVFALRQLPVVLQRQAEHACGHSLRNCALKQPLDGSGRGGLHGIFRVFRLKYAQMVRKADHGVGIAHGFARRVEHLIAADVAEGHIFQHRERLGKAFMAGRPVAEEIAVCGVDVRLVDGDPVADQIAEAVGAKLCEGQKIVQILPL